MNLPTASASSPASPPRSASRSIIWRACWPFPIQAVAEAKGKHFAYVFAAAGIERREVTVGENNEKYVEVRGGLVEGESVFLDARARVNSDFQSGDKEAKRLASGQIETFFARPRKMGTLPWHL